MYKWNFKCSDCGKSIEIAAEDTPRAYGKLLLSGWYKSTWEVKDGYYVIRCKECMKKFY